MINAGVGVGTIRAGIAWTGGGSGTSWGTAANWGGALPLFDGTEAISLSSGISSGATLTLDGNRNVSSLTISANSAFTLATGTGGTLNIYSGNLTQSMNKNNDGDHTISAGITLGSTTGAAYTGTWSITTGNGGIFTVSGNISEAGGARGINKTGADTLILSGTNSFSGGLTMTAGTVQVSSDANLGAASGSLTFNGGTLNVANSALAARAVAFTGSVGSFNVGTGKVFETTGVISGNGALNANSLNASYLGSLILSGSGSNGTGSTSVSGLLSLRGTVSLGTGNLSLNYGVLELGNSNMTRALGTGAGQVNLGTAYGGGFAAYGANRVVNFGGAGATVTWGTGSFVLSGQALYLGSQSATNTVDFQNGINLNGLTGIFDITRGTASGSDAKLSGVISGALSTSNITINGPQTYLPGSAGILELTNGNNSYAGTTTIDAGTLLLGANATGTSGNTVLGSGTSAVLLGNTSGTSSASVLTNGGFAIGRDIRAQTGNSGTITIGGNSASSSTFSGNIYLGTSAASGNSIGKAVTLTAASGGTTTFSGVIQDPTLVVSAGQVTKSGAGTVVLSGANTYTGGTAINAGTLAISSATSLGTGALIINAGTLDVTGTWSTSRAITLGNSASTIEVDPSRTYTVSSAIGGSGALNKTGTGTLQLGGSNTYTGTTNVSAGTLQITASERIANTGALTVSGGTFDLQSFNETVAAVTLSSGSIVGSGILTGSSYNMQSGTISAALGGTASLTKTGSGTLTLNGTNTYTGGTTINGGTVVANTANSLGASASTLTLNAGTLEITTGYITTRNVVVGDAASTFQIDANQTYTIAGAMSGSGTLNKTGAGTMLVANAVSFTGGTNVTAGMLILNGSNLLIASGAIDISGGTFNMGSFDQIAGTVSLTGGTINGSGTLSASSFALQSGTVNAPLGGNGVLSKTGSGIVTLNATNTYTGATSVSAGIVEVTANGALGSAASGSTVANGAALRLNNVNYSTAESLSLNGSGISNGGSLVNVGTSTFAGAISAATDATISAGGGTLNLTGGLAKNGTILTLTGGGQINISGSGITGSLAHSDLVVDRTTVTLSAASSYNGPTTIQNSGTLQLGSSNVLPTSPQTAMTINTSSAFDMASYNDGVASVAGDSTGTIKNSVSGTTSTLTVNPASGISTTFAGVIAGTSSGAQGEMSLVKNGAGTLVLSGANTFSGTTTVNAGTLTVAASAGSALGSASSITVNSGGTLLLGASDQIKDTAGVTLAGGTFAKGNYSEGSTNSAGVGALTLTASGSHIDFGTGTVGTLTFASLNTNTNTLLIDNWSGVINTIGSSSTDRLIFANDQTANLSSFQFNGFGPGAAEFAVGNGYYEVVPLTAVPEPATYLAGAFTMAVILLETRRRRKRRFTI